MTTRRKITLAVFCIPLLGVFALFLTLYPKFAEDNAWMRPFGWLDLPEQRPYTESEVAAGYRGAADRARDIVQDHLQEINVPAFSAAIAVDGKLVWSAAAGYADLEQKRKATPNTLFRIGSTSKAVTGTLFARMVDDTLVSLDAPISDYINDLPNPDWAQITPRQLASHTAGIVGYEENRDVMGVYATMRLHNKSDDVAEGLEYFDDTELLYEPGTDFHYSSFDVNLLSVVLQEARGASFQDLIHDGVLRPLRLGSPLPDAPHPDRALFYHTRDGRAQQWREVDLSMKLAGGGFMATPGDLATLGAAWLDDDFISPSTRRQFWTPQPLADGSVNEQNYALNWRVSEATDEVPYTYMHHGGVSKGSMALLAVIPEKCMSIALAINTRVWPFSRWAGVFTELVRVFDDSTSVDDQPRLPDRKHGGAAPCPGVRLNSMVD
ncbi:MAG: serine hydrolase [Bacteroidetes bacterium]|jgi:CubicO group peptidase (beta-lactamase class C family)|nr:serine hydrolase [Bacteroidota bacterium]